ncbi:amidohydrolase [Saccharopolyspora sp. NPDC000359]|uniref:amidohydrolase n=1 Tax=Saccharopolyspora sp. NPDC000359 TaxID=3154251 RepID=UPI0033345E8D
MCDLHHSDHEHAAPQSGLSRRQVLHLLGAAGVTSAGLAMTGDAAMAATASDTTSGYTPPTGLAKDTPAKRGALAWIDAHGGDITALNDEVWEHAELSLREWNSSIAEAEFLRRNGFQIEWGAAGFPTAFVATFHNGAGPTLGFSGEYDALPGLSQKKGAGQHDPLVYHHDPFAPTYGPGHGCGHAALGSAAAGAAAATAQGMRRNGVGGTIKFFGSTAEEQLIGKAYAVREGVYRGLDAFLDWHPGTTNSTGWGTSSALTAVTFTFLGVAGHGGLPLGNKSALDAAIMLATMTEFLREEHLAPSGRLHYVINNGGDAPNVTPEIAQISYYVREGSPERVKVLFDKVVSCAQAAAQASQTRVEHKITAACWNKLPSRSAAELLHENMLQIGPPRFTDADQRLAREIQDSLGLPTKGVSTEIGDLEPPNPAFLGGGSTDVADISWQVPTVSLGTAVAPIGCKTHNWAFAATTAAPMGHAALLAASKYLAALAIDLLTQPERLQTLKDEFAERTKDVEWRSMLPADFEPPMYEPPEWFLKRTGQSWPPRNITWPPPRVVSREKFASLGPDLAPQT